MHVLESFICSIEQMRTTNTYLIVYIFPSRGNIKSLKIKFAQFYVTGIKYYIVIENPDFSFVQIDKKLFSLL